MCCPTAIEGDTLADTLARSGDEDRGELLRALGSALGKMHAGTAGREEDYDALLKRQLRRHPEYAEHQALRDDSLQSSILIGADILSEAGLEPPEHVRTLARAAMQSLSSGRNRAFTPFDLSPDNIIVGSTLTFLDYEWAGFRNVGFDVACVVVSFPQFLFLGRSLMPRRGFSSMPGSAALSMSGRSSPMRRRCTSCSSPASSVGLCRA